MESLLLLFALSKSPLKMPVSGDYGTDPVPTPLAPNFQIKVAEMVPHYACPKLWRPPPVMKRFFRSA
jgi:hypothetical protein